MSRLAEHQKRQIDLALEDELGDDLFGFDRDDGDGGGGTSFLAKIQTQGPSSEVDYTDMRYWVQEVDDTSASATDLLSLAVIPVANGGRWSTAHNMVEKGTGVGGNGTHAIVLAVTGIVVPDRFVRVRVVRFKTSGVRYEFDSYPGQIQTDMYAFLKTSCLAGLCPDGNWYKTTGPGITSQEVPPQCPS